MKNRTTEFRVGLFSLISIGIFVYILYLVNSQFFERAHKVTYRTLVDNAQGVVHLTAVRSGGVLVGQVTNVRLVATQTEIELAVDSSLRIPQGSGLVFRSRGLLGETFVEIIRAPDSDQLIPDGGIIPLHKDAVDTSEMLEFAGHIAADVQVITAELREAVAAMDTVQLAQNIEAVFADLKAVTADLRHMVHVHQDSVSDSLTQLNAMLSSFAQIAANDPLASVDKLATDVGVVIDDVETTVGDMKQMMAKINRGEGTLGQLIQDDQLISDISEISQHVKSMVGSASQLNLDVRYQNEFRSDFSFQHHFYTLLQFRPSRTYIFGVTAYPSKTVKKRVLPLEDGQLAHMEPANLVEETHITEEPSLRISAQISQRFKWAALRFGLFEGLGGVAIDGYFVNNRVNVTAEAYDFTTSSVLRRFGRLKLYSSIYLTPQLFLAGGLSDISRIPTHESRWEATRPFVGGGIQFTDNDIKNVIQLAP